MRNVLVPAVLAVVLLLPLRAEEPKITYEATELAPGMHMLMGVGGFGGGNMSLLIGKDRALLIDDGIPPLTGTLRRTIAGLTTVPVEFVINTHVHGDHVGGNAAFGKAGATIVAHDNLRRRMVDKASNPAEGDAPTPPEALPVLTFSDALTVYIDGRKAHVFHVANAHTDGDAVIHFPDDNVIHAGDVFFNGLFPFIDLDSGGSVSGFIGAQKRILSMAGEKTRIVPGHGPLAGKEELRAAMEMLEIAHVRVRKLVRAGHSEEQVLAANPLADYHDDWNWNFIGTERMTRTLYRDVTGD